MTPETPSQRKLVYQEHSGCTTFPPAYLTRIEQIKELTAEEQQASRAVSNEFAFRSNTYYQSLIDWNDPEDPIRRVIMPDSSELLDWGKLDASGEALFTVAPGVEHKYTSTALLLVTDICGGYCRFCFRKRLFMPDNDETAIDISEGVKYIRQHREITNVLLTGGDPLILSARRLREILTELASIDHIKVARIGSKMPAFNPARITNDASLLETFRDVGSRLHLYVITHFNHPRELTHQAREALMMLHLAGVTTANQTPLIRGVNDKAGVLAELFAMVAENGTPPYYVFQCRPTLGNVSYSVPLEEAYGIFVRAQEHCSGLAKRARFVMSHASGKIEVVGLSSGFIYLRYHEAVKASDTNRLFMLRSNPSATWLDDYQEIAAQTLTPA